MSPNEARRSGEHRAPNTASGEHVAYAHFNQWTDSFQKMFESHATRVENQLSDMNERLSAGSQRFTRQEAEVRSLKERTDEHSDKVKVLDDERIARDAIAAHTKPKSEIWNSVKGNVISAIVLGVLMAAFMMWRDWDKAQTATVSTTTTTTMTAPVAPPAPAAATPPVGSSPP